MSEAIERNLGPQPIAEILDQEELTAGDLVDASSEQLTHKMVNRACKGRRLTPNVQGKVLRALNAAGDKVYALGDLFNYD